MAQFIVSARKYRPASFGSLLGQDNIARTLKNSIQTGQMAHAYLFCGPRGVGKTTTARIFAKTINCLNPTAEMDPCGECESCRSFNEGRSYCIHELDAASNNSVEDIRTLTDQVRIPPQIGHYSVYIIDEVHMLSQAAFNAFLKTLEEPPAHAVFILATTEKNKILPTILSRCQTYDFNRITIDDMVRNLRQIAAKEEITISDDAMHIIAQKADGAMRDALTLFDQTVAFCGSEITYEMVISNLNVLDYEYYFKMTDFFLKGEYANALMLFDEILTKGFNALHFLSGLSTHFRDLIVCSNGASQALAELAPSVVARYKEYCRRCHINFLYQALGCTTTCEAAYKSSGNPRLLIEFTLMKLSQLMGQLQEGDEFAGTPATMQKSVESTSVTTQATAPQHAAAVAPTSATTTTPASKPITASEPVQTPVTEPSPAPQTTAQPAPAPSSQPAPAKASSNSISSLLKQVQDISNPVQTPEEAAQAAAANTLTLEECTKAWQTIVASIKNNDIKAGLLRFPPTYDRNLNVFTLSVVSQAQKEWLQNKAHSFFESNLRSALNSKTLKFLIAVVPPTEEELKEAKPYMPMEKARAMEQDNAQVKKFVQDFELEVN